jgi:hypothetical protein
MHVTTVEGNPKVNAENSQELLELGCRRCFADVKPRMKWAKTFYEKIDFRAKVAAIDGGASQISSYGKRSKVIRTGAMGFKERVLR